MSGTEKLPDITVNVKKRNNGLYDAYIETENSSVGHYADLTANEIGRHVAELIECLTETFE